jgi:hypothetical protein
LAQQQQQQQQQQQLQLQQHLAVQQQAQAWASASSLVMSQPLAGLQSPVQQPWHHQQQHHHHQPQLKPGSYDSSTSAAPAENLAASLAASSSAMGTLLGPTQPGPGDGNRAGSFHGNIALVASSVDSTAAAVASAAMSQQQGGMLKWSSSILSKQQSSTNSNSCSGVGGVAGLEHAPGGADHLPAMSMAHQCLLPGAMGGASPGGVSAREGLLASQGSAAAAAAAVAAGLPGTSLEHLNGLLQLVHGRSSQP